LERYDYLPKLFKAKEQVNISLFNSLKWVGFSYIILVLLFIFMPPIQLRHAIFSFFMKFLIINSINDSILFPNQHLFEIAVLNDFSTCVAMFLDVDHAGKLLLQLRIYVWYGLNSESSFHNVPSKIWILSWFTSLCSLHQWHSHIKSAPIWGNQKFPNTLIKIDSLQDAKCLE
jgi:hypothetical protein